MALFKVEKKPPRAGAAGKWDVVIGEDMCKACGFCLSTVPPCVRVPEGAQQARLVPHVRGARGELHRLHAVLPDLPGLLHRGRVKAGVALKSDGVAQSGAQSERSREDN